METHLRPLTLAEILDRTAQLYRSNFWLFAGISAVYSGALLALNLIQIGGQEYLRAQHMNRYLVGLTVVGFVFEFFVVFIVGGLAVAANNRAVAWVHMGEPATIRGAYASTLPRAGRYVWMMTLIGIIIWTPLLLAYVGFAGAIVFWVRPFSGGKVANLAANSTRAGSQPSVLFIVLTLAFIVVGFLALVYAIVMALRYALAIAASVVEDLKARPAIRRSVQLTSGSRGRIFVLGLLVIVIQVGLVSITQVFFILTSLKHGGQLAPGARILQQFVAFVTNTFIGPMYATGLTLFYYDQRVRKEGYDIEWMMQAAGMTRFLGVPDSPTPNEFSPAPTGAYEPENASPQTSQVGSPDKTDSA